MERWFEINFESSTNLFIAKGHLLANLPRSSCPRTLSLAMEWNDRSNPIAREPCHCEAWKAEAISLQAPLVFGLLRYARNDKNQDGHVVLKASSPWQLVLRWLHFIRHDTPELVRASCLRFVTSFLSLRAVLNARRGNLFSIWEKLFQKNSLKTFFVWRFKFH